MTSYDWLDALIGGILIGTAATLLMLARGRVFGISGILAGVLSPQRHDFLWRMVILAGLVLGGLPVLLLLPEKFTLPEYSSNVWPIVAGVLVGVGTQLGSGCTSGHGVCGIARFSVRSIVATLVFIGAGMLTVFLKGVLS